MKDHAKKKTSSESEAYSRREFLSGAVMGAGALAASAALGGLQACGGSNSDPAPSAGPRSDLESPDLRFGMIALTDSSPIIIAHEKGFFRKYGINSTIVKGANWAAIRDSLSNGDIHATHMLLGMPIASTMGLLGSPKKPMIIPWLMSRNGQGITLKKEWKGKVAADPEYCMKFSDRNCNYPQPKYATWWLTQFRRWGMVEGAPDYEGAVKSVMRPDIYEEAMKELGVAHGGRDDSGFALFDGVNFDPTKPEEYAAAFAVHSRKG